VAPEYIIISTLKCHSSLLIDVNSTRKLFSNWITHYNDHFGWLIFVIKVLFYFFPLLLLFFQQCFEYTMTIKIWCKKSKGLNSNFFALHHTFWHSSFIYLFAMIYFFKFIWNSWNLGLKCQIYFVGHDTILLLEVIIVELQYLLMLF